MAMTLDTVDLADNPDLAGEQLEWTDEWEWNAIEQEQDRSLTGALIVQEGGYLCPELGDNLAAVLTPWL